VKPADWQNIALALQWCNPEAGTAGYPPCLGTGYALHHAKGMRAGYRYGGGTNHQRTALICLQEVSAAEEVPQGWDIRRAEGGVVEPSNH
jgi:hypothetical protein